MYLEFACLRLPGQFWAALLMIVLAMVYTVTSGLYGVLVTDLFQSVLIFVAVGYLITVSMTEFVLPDVFTVSAPLTEGGFELIETTRQAWDTGHACLEPDFFCCFRVLVF